VEADRVCPEEGDLTQECRDAGVETQVLAQMGLWSTSVRVGERLRLPQSVAWARNGYSLVAAARALRSLLIQSPPDLVITKGLAAHFSGGVTARRLGIPCVWHAQDLISERNFGVYRRAFGRAARWLPTQIIVDEPASQNNFRNPATAHHGDHNGVDTNVFRPDSMALPSVRNWVFEQTNWSWAMSDA